jgi:hypothetical protein
LEKIITNGFKNYLEKTLLMIRNSMEKCPDDIWTKAKEHYYIWQHAYHALYYCDLWLSESIINFKNPEGFLKDSFEMNSGDDVIPKSKLLDYNSLLLTQKLRTLKIVIKTSNFQKISKN